MEYNTTRNQLVMREYGRHIQRMIEYLMTLDDNEKRQKNARTVIELMGFLNPHLKNVEDFRHMLWDHLFLISDFQLEVESPYPIPTRETLKAKPGPLRYPKGYPRYSHIGRNIETVINKALAEENPEKRQGFANAIAYYMKLVYSNWHKEIVHDDAIQGELSGITQGQLEFTSTPVVKAFRQNEGQRDFRGGGGNGNKRPQKFQQRNNSGGNRGNDMRGNDMRGNDMRGNDNRGGSDRNNGNRGNNKFNKKRFK